jgi:hypothetical protein
MTVPYQQLSRQILDELSSKLDSLDEVHAKHFSKQLCAFYQYVTYSQTVPLPEEEEDSSLYVITMGVLMNHFLKNESPQIPHYSFQNGQ